jgi:hypothetical protein
MRRDLVEGVIVTVSGFFLLLVLVSAFAALVELGAGYQNILRSTRRKSVARCFFAKINYCIRA